VLRIAGIRALEELAGESLGSSPWVEMTWERILQFAEATGDHQWIHTDAERAASGPFGAPVAHGYLSLALIPYLASLRYRIEGVTMVINYGVNRVRYPSPVTVGSVIRTSTRLLSTAQAERGCSAVFSHTVEIDGNEKPACVAETVSLIIP